jgi:hypothetical protein
MLGGGRGSIAHSGFKHLLFSSLAFCGPTYT